MDASESSTSPSAVVAAAAARSLADRLAEHRPVLLALARRLARSQADADDLVQDTIERGLRKGAEIPPPKLRSWLITVQSNLFIDQCRQRARRPVASPDAVDALPAAESEPELAWHSLDAAALRAAVDQLPDDFAEVYRMHAFKKMRYAEISAALDVPSATVGTRLLRARKRLKEILMKTMATKDGSR